MQCLTEVFTSSLLLLVSLLFITCTCSFMRQQRISLRPMRTNDLRMVGLDSNRDIQGVAQSSLFNKVPKPGDRKTFKRFMQVFASFLL